MDYGCCCNGKKWNVSYTAAQANSRKKLHFDKDAWAVWSYNNNHSKLRRNVFKSKLFRRIWMKYCLKGHWNDFYWSIGRKESFTFISLPKEEKDNYQFDSNNCMSFHLIAISNIYKEYIRMLILKRIHSMLAVQLKRRYSSTFVRRHSIEYKGVCAHLGLKSSI